MDTPDYFIDYTIRSTEADTMHRHMGEAISWCSYALNGAQPGTSLRTPSLKPDRMPVTQVRNTDGTFGYVRTSAEERAESVRRVCNRRATLLSERKLPLLAEAIPSDRSLGRLLVCDIESSTWEGLSTGECNGFLDDFDIPAWDTWIDYQSTPAASLLLCWIPLPLVPMLASAIAVNTTACLGWARLCRV